MRFLPVLLAACVAAVAGKRPTCPRVDGGVRGRCRELGNQLLVVPSLLTGYTGAGCTGR